MKQYGLTMLEVLLVLAIAGVLLVAGFRQFQSFRADADVTQVRANVDAYLQAAALYYTANCTNPWDPIAKNYITNASTGTLDPTHTPAPPDSGDSYKDEEGTAMKDILEQNYIGHELPASPIAEDYVVQFNRSDADREITISSGANKKIGTTVIWRIQVAVKLKNPSKANIYLLLLRGDCLTNNANDTCPNTGNQYVVFERLPSFPTLTGEAMSNYWMTMPLLKQFNQLYSIYPAMYLVDTTGDIPAGKQYFLCAS